MKRLLSILLGAALVATARGAEKLNVVATLPDLGAIAAKVGGPLINLTTLANASEDPHFVDPKPSFARVLNKADLLIEGGADLESGWLPPLVQNARNAKILPGQSGRVSGAMGVEMKERPAALDRSQGDVHPGGNPHYLMDPLNAIAAAKNMAERMGTLAPGNAALFRENAGAFEKELRAKLKDWEKAMAPLKGAKVITYHRSFNYLLDRFGIELFDTLEPKPGIEPSPTHVAGLIQRAKGAGVKLVLIEENRSRRTPDRVAADLGGKVIVLNHLPQATADGYMNWMNGIVDAMTKSAK